MTADYSARRAQLAAIPEVDAVAIVPGANMLYFTGLDLHLSERPIIALFTPDGQMSVIIPELEAPRLAARPDLAARAFPWSDTDGYEGAFSATAQALGLGEGAVLGVDGMTMRVTEGLALQQAAPGLALRPVERALIAIRARKQPDEIALMRRAVAVAEQALDRLLAWVQPGMTERQIAAQLVRELEALGSSRLAFEPLVQTGPNSALPHVTVTERALQPDEFFLVDFGAVVDGYPSDITRTFCLGAPSAEMQTIFDTVLRANEAARAAAGPGVPMGDVDRAARAVIEAAGYGPYFIHRTGHGLGLDAHEPIPQIAAGVPDLLEPGMAFTIEPGVYIPGLGGVRIEDDVVVTETGLDVLTSYPRRLAPGR